MGSPPFLSKGGGWALWKFAKRSDDETLQIERGLLKRENTIKSEYSNHFHSKNF